MQTWAGLLLTGYGRSLLVKLVLVIAALALGAYNSIRKDTAQRLGRIALESAMAAAVVFAAAVLVDLPPATTAGTSGTALANEVGATLQARAGDLKLSTRVSPGRIGSNVFELSLPTTAASRRLARRPRSTFNHWKAARLLTCHWPKPAPARTWVQVPGLISQASGKSRSRSVGRRR